MVSRARLFVSLGVTAVLITSCGSDDADQSDQVSGVDEAGQQENDDEQVDDHESEAASDDGIDRPEIVLPDDVVNEFEPAATDDPMEQEILADNERYVDSVDEALTQDDTDGAMAFYVVGDALDANVGFVGAMKDDNESFAGTTRYYHREVEVIDEKTAEVTYCADASDSYIYNTETGEEEPDSGLTAYYTTGMRLSEEGVWQTFSFSVDRGLEKCD